MPSAIDPTQPPAIAPTTAGVRANFVAAKAEIEALQAADILLAQRTDDLGRRLSTLEVAGLMMTPQAIGGVTVSTLAVTPNTLRFYPFICPKDGTLSSYMLNITTLGAGNARMGIYAESESFPGMPGLQLDDAGEFSQGATGIITRACGFAVTKGQRLYLVHHSAIAATYTALTALQMPVPYPPAIGSFTTGRNCGTYATAYAALPPDLSGYGWTLALAAAPMVGITVA